jgi:hypothetical protein
MHSRERQTIEQMTNLLSETIGVKDYVILFSKRDLKKGTGSMETKQ